MSDITRILITARFTIVLLAYSIFTHGQQKATDVLRIDPSNALSLPVSELLDEVTYIPLETTKESLFGSIYQMVVTADNFIIYDKDSHSVLFFSKSGKFLRRFKSGVYDSPGFLLNPTQHELIIQRGSVLSKYSFEGTKKGEIRRPYPGAPYYFPGNTVVYANYGVKENVFPDTIVHEITLTRGDKQYASFLPYNSKTAPIETADWVMNNHYDFYQGPDDTTVFYTKYYDYSIYKITPAGLSKAYGFILPLSNTLPDSFFTTSSLQKGNRRAYFQTHRSVVSGISFPYQIGNVLFFNLNSWEFSLNNGDSYIYHLKSGTLASVGHILPDEKSYFLPVTDLGIGDEFYNRNFLTSDGRCIYTSISAANFLLLKDQVTGTVTYPKELVTFFKKGSRLSNPVIVALKPKTEF